MDLKILQKRLQEQCELKIDQPTLAGISGGPDSLCMLHVLSALGYRVIVAHYNHQLRPEAGDDAKAVKDFADKAGLPFILGEGNVAAFSRKNHLSIEEAARVMRYQFLFSEAKKWQAQAVAVAHTADDQVETVLMHLLRGAGLSGLKGMAYRSILPEWSGEIPLVRPLLDVWREEVMEYCQANQLKPLFDATNLDQTYYRNRLRHELFPFLSTYNPRVKEVIWRMSQSLSGDYEDLEAIRQQAWDECLLLQNEGGVVLSRSHVLKKSRGMQRGVFRKSIACLRPDLRDIDYETIERGIDFVYEPPRSGQCDLVSGLRLVVEDDRIILSDWDINIFDNEWPQMAPGQVRELFVPGEVLIEGGWMLQCEEIQLTGEAKLPEDKDDPNQAWLDKSSVSIPMQVRTRNPGERFKPLGMGGHSLKLADFWVNKKLPRRARQGWPLVCSGKEIAWIPGFRPGEPFKVSENTISAVHLRLKRRD
jgi:tRNA(Ile)-lysidine synthase